MDELTSQLEKILNDPGSLSQIMTLASNLGIQPPKDLTPEEGPQIAAQMNRLLTQNQEREKKQQALVRALLPYLQPQRQARLERAMQVAHLSHLAGALGSAAPKEGDEHV